MGGGPCKTVIDDANAQAMAMQFYEVLEGVNKIAFEIFEYMSEKERHAALEMSYETCQFADEVIKPFSDKVSKFWIDMAKKHQYDGDSYEGRRNPDRAQHE